MDRNRWQVGHTTFRVKIRHRPVVVESIDSVSPTIFPPALLTKCPPVGDGSNAQHVGCILAAVFARAPSNTEVEGIVRISLGRYSGVLSCSMESLTVVFDPPVLKPRLTECPRGREDATSVVVDRTDALRPSPTRKLSSVARRKMSMSHGKETRLLRCSQCGGFYPARPTKDDNLVPSGGSQGGKCKSCGSDQFEQVALAPSD